jgi:hypothetical protein
MLYDHSVMYLGGTGALIFLACFIGSVCRLKYIIYYRLALVTRSDLFIPIHLCVYLSVVIHCVAYYIRRPILMKLIHH